MKKNTLVGLDVSSPLIKTRKERKLTNEYFQLHLDNFIKT